MEIKGYTLKEELIFEIGRFSILWNWFERFKCDNFCNPDKIKNVCENITIDKEKEIAFANVLNNRRNLYNMIIADYVEQALHPDNARNSNEENKKLMEEFMKQSKDASTCGCFLIIYRIRNNLMHGIKQIEELNEQLELFKAVNEVLESVKEKIDG